MKQFFLVLVLGLITSNAYCCDCAEKPSTEKNWEIANQVFIGKVVKVDSLLYGTYGEKVYSFTVKIKKTFKEDVYPNREYRTILYVDTAACDFVFSTGHEYLIYAKGDDKVLSCSLCSRTDLVENVAKSELLILSELHQSYIKNRGEIRIIKFQNNIEYQIDLVKNSFEESLKRKTLIIYMLAVVVVLFLIIILILLIRRKKRMN